MLLYRVCKYNNSGVPLYKLRDVDIYRCDTNNNRIEDDSLHNCRAYNIIVSERRIFLVDIILDAKSE